eukprot:Colp12_sorted_trinity150504_noHs@17994
MAEQHLYKEWDELLSAMESERVKEQAIKVLLDNGLTVRNIMLCTAEMLRLNGVPLGAIILLKPYLNNEGLPSLPPHSVTVPPPQPLTSSGKRPEKEALGGPPKRLHRESGRQVNHPEFNYRRLCGVEGFTSMPDHTPRGADDISQLQHFLEEPLRLSIGVEHVDHYPHLSWIVGLTEVTYSLPLVELACQFATFDYYANELQTQHARHIYYDQLFGVLAHNVASELDLSVRFNRDATDDSGSGASKKTSRPDFLLYLQDTLLVKGEEEVSDFEKAKGDLVLKMTGAWSPVYFGTLPYIIVYAATGSSFQLFALDRNLNLTPASRKFNLNRTEHRLLLVQSAVNVVRLLRLMKNALPAHPVPLYTEIRRDTCNIKFMGTYVLKHLHGELPQAQADLRMLYEAVNKCPCSIRGKVVGRQTIEIRPIGLVATKHPPQNESEMRKMVCSILRAIGVLHGEGYVHRDIRLPNILKRVDGSWLLADFELAASIGFKSTYRPNVGNRTFPEILCGEGWGAQADLFLVGALFDAVSVEWSEAAVAFSTRLLQREYNTAAECLEDAWFGLQ